ncbi:helix-turn-helix domain-containing protein [Paenibacillus sp. Marseille-Q4541]|uniref:helix-turn-helix domain-containing protein n=1 Tax=Paenibacillus sp. Marseille-Q4541 TaxID=2831522 RepID=UPI001BAC4106|nr:helix-turn-helix domain-containing protein [Paenibacillus sp. Marseille-Q4541]
MNILLVDDDYFVVAALEKKIDWEALSIERVYSAYNIAQAKEILLTESIQILVCDIEMPQGSGLDLLAWVREEGYQVQAIFLTNYADFNYAQKAIELQSFDYFLKPIEFDKLTLILSKAIYKAKEQEKKEIAVQEGQLWQKNHNKMREHFWRKLIMEKRSAPGVDFMEEAIEEQKLSYKLTDLFLPVYIQLFPYDQSLGKNDEDLFNYAFLNVFTELFQHPFYSIEAILEAKENNWVIMLKWNQAPLLSIIDSSCDSFVQKANRFLKSDAFCAVGISAPLQEIHPVIGGLFQMNEEIIKHRNQTMYLADYEAGNQDITYPSPDLKRWEQLLIQDHTEVLLSEIQNYLNSLTSHPMLNTSILRLFRLDLIQLVYSYLKSKEIEAHKLYTGKTNDLLSIQSLHSISDMAKYAEYLVHTAKEYRHFTEQQDSVVEEIKQYIHLHYGQDLTRISLAEIVYLNPDYLARIFKKETGISLGTYIIQTRIEAAKRLLEMTSLSVYAVGTKVGYGNYPYFSKLFKQDTGLTPSDYRRSKQILTLPK